MSSNRRKFPDELWETSLFSDLLQMWSDRPEDEQQIQLWMFCLFKFKQATRNMPIAECRDGRLECRLQLIRALARPDDGLDVATLVKLIAAHRVTTPQLAGWMLERMTNADLCSFRDNWERQFDGEQFEDALARRDHSIQVAMEAELNRRSSSNLDELNQAAAVAAE